MLEISFVENSVIVHNYRLSSLLVDLPTTGTETALRTTCLNVTRERILMEPSMIQRASCTMRE